MTHSSLLEVTYIYCSFATANMFLNKISSNQNNKEKWGCLLVATIAWLEHAQSFLAMRAWMATQCAGQISTAMRCICTKSWHLCFFSEICLNNYWIPLKMNFSNWWSSNLFYDQIPAKPVIPMGLLTIWDSGTPACSPHHPLCEIQKHKNMLPLNQLQVATMFPSKCIRQNQLVLYKCNFLQTALHSGASLCLFVVFHQCI